MTHNAEFQVEKVIPSLIGGTITEAFTDKEKEFFGFTVKKGKKTFKVWVDGDEEGNYCGALKVEDEGRQIKSSNKQAKIKFARIVFEEEIQDNANKEQALDTLLTPIQQYIDNASPDDVEIHEEPYRRGE